MIHLHFKYGWRLKEMRFWSLTICTCTIYNVRLNAKHLCEDAFLQLDTSDAEVTANFPLHFCLQLARFFGFSLQNNYSDERNLFNCREGNFANKILVNDYFVEPSISYYISQLLKALQPEDLPEIKLNKNIRRTILSALENYYAFHIPEFGVMKTLPVLHELLG